MRWSDIQFNPSPKTLRQFAGAWVVFFLGLAALHGLARGHKQFGIVLAVAAVVVGTLGLIKPPAVRPFYVVWMVLAFPIGWVVSQLALALMFYGVLTPVAVLFRLRGRDALRRKRPPDSATYWIPKQISEDVRSYFRQY